MMFGNFNKNSKRLEPAGQSIICYPSVPQNVLFWQCNTILLCHPWDSRDWPGEWVFCYWVEISEAAVLSCPCSSHGNILSGLFAKTAFSAWLPGLPQATGSSLSWVWRFSSFPWACAWWGHWYIWCLIFSAFLSLVNGYPGFINSQTANLLL